MKAGAPWIERSRPTRQTFPELDQGRRDEYYLERLAYDLHAQGEIDLSECFNGTFAPAKKGGLKSAKLNEAKAPRLWPLQTLMVFRSPLRTAQKHEVKLVQNTLVQRFTADLPQRLIGDKAYDSDPLDAELAEAGVEMIAPHRRNRKKPKTQDGRKLRRYKRRWKVERFFSWLYNFRRLPVRYEYHAANYLTFVQLACIVILLRYF